MIKNNFELQWEEWEAPMEYVNWTCSCGNVNSGRSTVCLKCHEEKKR